MLAGRCMFLLLLLLVLLLLAPSSGGSKAEREAPARGHQLQRVIKSAVSGLSKLGKTVKGYQSRLNDTQTRALLADCLDLATDSKDVVKESLSILLKLNSSGSSSSSSSGGTGTDTGSEDGELVRTNLSAALTDITTCTDGLEEELSDESEQTKVAVERIVKQAAKVSVLLSRALRLVGQ